jgi:hypothetical protein
MPGASQHAASVIHSIPCTLHVVQSVEGVHEGGVPVDHENIPPPQQSPDDKGSPAYPR